MRYVRLAVLTAVVVAIGAIAGPRASHATVREGKATQDVIAVYLGTAGTDAQSGMIEAVRDMKSALGRQAATTNRRFVSRGVSLEALAEDGIAHLALMGRFDEISVGGNWANSNVIRYLGNTIGRDSLTAIPQVVLLERDIVEGQTTLQVGAEREIGRLIGAAAIANWVRRGAPLPK